MHGYQIADEPTPSDALGNFVFEPRGPLLATMMCGAWLAWPWFAINAIAMGSPTKKRELAMCGAALAGTIVLAFVVRGLVDTGVIESAFVLQLALLGISAWKVGMAYAISNVQQRAFDVYVFYGGRIQRTMLVLMLGQYLRGVVIGVSDDPIWRIIVSGGL